MLCDGSSRDFARILLSRKLNNRFNRYIFPIFSRKFNVYFHFAFAQSRKIVINYYPNVLGRDCQSTIFKVTPLLL